MSEMSFGDFFISYTDKKDKDRFEGFFGPKAKQHAAWQFAIGHGLSTSIEDYDKDDLDTIQVLANRELERKIREKTEEDERKRKKNHDLLMKIKEDMANDRL